MAFAYTIFETELGWVGLVRSSRGLVRCTLPRISREATLAGMALQAGAIQDRGALTDVRAALVDFYRGRCPTFSFPVDLLAGTPFQRRVWTATSAIPYGETRSYAWVAREAGNPAAFRAAGQALGRNPIAIIVPCHRVIASDGSLGGFGGELEMKERLLALERGGSRA